MPIVFIIVGLVMIIAGSLGNGDELLQLVRGDITGQSNFIYWFVSILLIGALGYVNQLRPLSQSFLVLVFIVLIISSNNKPGSGGLFKNLNDALKNVNASQNTQTTNAEPA